MRHTWIVAAIALLTGAGCRSVSTNNRLDAYFSDLHARGLFDGAVVITTGEVTYAKSFGYANVERKVPFTPDTAADGASLAKTFTAALLLILQRDGIIDLDQPAQKFLPELPYPDITLRHLLSHSSGIPVLDYDYFDRYLPSDLLRVIAEQKPSLASRPGTAFEYSSFGYDLAALAASRAAGKSYFELLQDRIFAPLGITSAFARPARLHDFPGIRTLGYRHTASGLEVHDVFDFEAFAGGSNLYISARDLNRWNMSFLGAPITTRDALETARVANAPSGLTLGSWYSTPDRSAFWYSGHLQGFHDEVFRDTRKRWSIVYMSNNTIEPWLQKGVVRTVTAILDGAHVEPYAPPAVEEIRKEERAALAGEWLMPGGDTLTIDMTGGHLNAVRDGVRYRIVQISPRAFYIPGLDHILGFAKDRIYLSTNVAEEWGARAKR
jgi:CubicO group peptidase (beta-lactamase class C family)